MNCKPHQLAWIVVPRHHHGSGIEQIDGHVVKTLLLLQGHSQPVWAVTPAQVVTFCRREVDDRGRALHPGETCTADGIPDAWLRPFDPRSAPQPSIEHLELAA